MIKYMPNGDDVINIPPDTLFIDAVIPSISNVIPVRYGYTFMGWLTNPNAIDGNLEYGPGKTYFGPNLVLYAIWEVREIAPEANQNIVMDDGKRLVMTPYK